MFHLTTWSFFQSEVIRICSGEKTRDDLVNMIIEFAQQLLKNKAYEGYRTLIYYPLSNMTTVAYNSSIPRTMTLFESSAKLPRKNTAGTWLSGSSDPFEDDKSKPILTQAEIDIALMQEFLLGREVKYYLTKNHTIYQNIEKNLEFLKMMKKVVYHIYELKNERFEINNANHMKLLKKFKKNMAGGLPKTTNKQTALTTDTTDSKTASTKGNMITNFASSILKTSNGSSSRSTTPTRSNITSSTIQTTNNTNNTSTTNTTSSTTSTESTASNTSSVSSKKKSTKSDKGFFGMSKKLLSTNMTGHSTVSDPIGEDEEEEDEYSFDWTQLGFQGQDPSTDFRDMGMLGLTTLLYFSEHRKQVANFILHKLSFANKQCFYPFAIIGINITRFLIEMIQEMRIQKTMIINLAHCLEGNKILEEYDILPSDDNTCLQFGMNIIYDLYCVIFEEFYLQWTIVHPESIMSFNSIFEEVKKAIREKNEPL